MPVIKVWYCSECHDGPYNWEFHSNCQGCGHKRCKICRVENDHQQTPRISLHTAVKKNNMDLVQQLLENGADVDTKNSNADTPLHIAVQNDSIALARFLLDKGASINATNSNADTPLHIAVQNVSAGLARVLLEKGAMVNATNSNADTPLHIAVENERLDITRVLLRYGADFNATNSNFGTPLHIAIKNGDLVTITALLGAGANVNMPRGSGETALTMAIQRKLHDVVDILLEAGALLRETIRYHVSQWSRVELEVKWRVAPFVLHELSGKFDDLRKVVTLTGSVKNAQMMSVEDYVAQTWKENGLRVLNALIEVMRTGFAELDLSAGQTATFRTDRRGLLKIALKTSQEHTVDIMEQIAWLESVFSYEKTKPKDRGLLLATGYYSFSSPSRRFCLSIGDYSLEKYPDEPCWTNVLRSATLAVGFPVRKRPEGVGLEIPFPLLLRFADISVSMEYDGGTLLIGASTILFPSQKLEDGIQWHVTDAASIQKAVEVIDQSPDWIRTDDIGQLAQLRAYLGYCSRALVLLGTRELLMSQPAIESSRPLPKAKSQIELVHEGTMSAGVSIRGIFNATVSGKWIVPTQLNVSLEEFRDVYDLLLTTSRRPILIYNSNEDRGWLVPELSLVFHMALTYLHQPDVRQRCLASVQETLPYLIAAADVFQAYDIIRIHWKFELYEKLEDGQMKTFGMVIYDFIKDLQKLRTAENIRRVSKGRRFAFPVFASRSLRGWDFSELVLKAENIAQREMKWENSKGPSWTMLGDTEDMLVILGSCLGGDLICPDLEATKVPSGWEVTPMGAGLLTATNSCVKQLAQKQVLMASKEHGGDLFWYSPASFHADCNQNCNQSCLIIHEITRPGYSTCTQTRNPRELKEGGAVVFGCASSYHKSLEPRLSN